MSTKSLYKILFKPDNKVVFALVIQEQEKQNQEYDSEGTKSQQQNHHKMKIEQMFRLSLSALSYKNNLTLDLLLKKENKGTQPKSDAIENLLERREWKKEPTTR